MLGEPSAGEISCLSRAAQRNQSVGENTDPSIFLSPSQTSPRVPQTPPLSSEVPKRGRIVMSAVDIRADSQSSLAAALS